ncbi:MAG: PAS domain S-box protein [Kofleriaceae bacterium]|nr:PAS domain S-box protein [Kofleriaceae bacterium]
MGISASNAGDTKVTLSETLEEWPETAFKNSREATFVVGGEGEILKANFAVENLFGYLEEEMIGLSVESLVSETYRKEHGQDAKELFRANLSSVSEGVRELPAVRKSGEVFWVAIETTAALFEGKSAVVVEMRDIAEHDIASEGDAKYKAFFENSIDAMLIIEGDTIVDCNPAASGMLGYEGKAKLINIHPSQLSPEFQPDGRLSGEKASEMIEMAYAKGAHRFEWDHLRGTGEIIPVEVSLTRLHMGGKPIIHAVMRDLSTRKLLEKTRLETYDIFLSSPAVAFLWRNEDEWPVDAVSSNVYSLLGYTAQEFMAGALSYSDVIHDDDKARVGAEVTEFSTDKERSSFDHEPYRITTQEGRSKWVQDRTVICRNDKGEITHFKGFIVDITTQIEAQEDATRLSVELAQAQKMEAVGRLAGGIAHDFNNLLTVINSYASSAIERLDKNNSMRFDMTQILEAGQRAATLTHQLLTFSRKQPLNIRVVDVNEVIGNLIRMLKRLIGEDIEIETDFADNLGYIKSDPAQIEQVLVNLVVNARDAMPQGGKLTIRTANEVLADDQEGSPGVHALISVTDTGVGMSAEICDRIFEPFFTTKELGKGTGLGLSLVYGIVRQNGGSIEVASEVGQGTTFRVSFPIVNAEKVKPTTVDKTEVRGTGTVLLVEDESSVRTLITRILESAGYRVISAANGGEALLAFEQHKSEIHLLLTDVVMPRMSGKVLADRMTKTRPSLLVLFMSGYTSDSLDNHGVFETDIHFIAKPFIATELLQKIQSVLAPPKALSMLPTSI